MCLLQEGELEVETFGKIEFRILLGFEVFSRSASKHIPLDPGDLDLQMNSVWSCSSIGVIVLQAVTVVCPHWSEFRPQKCTVSRVELKKLPVIDLIHAGKNQNKFPQV